MRTPFSESCAGRPLPVNVPTRGGRIVAIPYGGECQPSARTILRVARHSAGIRSGLQNAVYGAQFSLMLLSFRLAACHRRSPQVVRSSSSQYEFETR